MFFGMVSGMMGCNNNSKAAAYREKENRILQERKEPNETPFNKRTENSVIDDNSIHPVYSGVCVFSHIGLDLFVF